MSFLDLPMELRSMIYIAAGQDSALVINLGAANPNIHRLGNVANLLCCNKQIREEASEVIFKDMALYIRGWKPAVQRNALVLTIPEIWRSSITNVHSSIYFDATLTQAFPKVQIYRLYLSICISALETTEKTEEKTEEVSHLVNNFSAVAMSFNSGRDNALAPHRRHYGRIESA